MEKDGFAWDKNFNNFAVTPKFLHQGSIFSCSRKRLTGERMIKTYGGEEIFIDGYLSQWDQIVSKATRKVMQETSREFPIFKLSSVLYSIKRKDSKRYRDMIFDSLLASKNTRIGFNYGGNSSYYGSRVKDVNEINSSTIQTVQDEQYLQLAYAKENMCCMDMDIYFCLRAGLQTWLYGFFCSEPQLKEIDIDWLHQLSGCDFKRRCDFSKSLKVAMFSLVRKGAISCKWFLSSGTLGWDLVMKPT